MVSVIVLPLLVLIIINSSFQNIKSYTGLHNKMYSLDQLQKSNITLSHHHSLQGFSFSLTGQTPALLVYLLPSGQSAVVLPGPWVCWCEWPFPGTAWLVGTPQDSLESSLRRRRIALDSLSCWWTQGHQHYRQCSAAKWHIHVLHLRCKPDR